MSDLRAAAEALCDEVLTERVIEIWRVVDAARALRAALAAPEPSEGSYVTPAETGPCYDAHGVERPPNPETVTTWAISPVPPAPEAAALSAQVAPRPRRAREGDQVTTTRQTANERRLAKLLRSGDGRELVYLNKEDAEFMAAFLARRGVLAVCAATVPAVPLGSAPSAAVFRAYLRRLARGQR